MKKLSLRWRLTLVTVTVLAAVCIFTSLYSIFNANQMLSPLSSEIEFIGVAAQDMTNTVTVLSNAAPAGFYSPDVSMSYNPYYSPAASAAYWSKSIPFYSGTVSAAPGAGSIGAVYAVAQSAAVVNQVETMSFTIAAVQESFNYSSLAFMAAMILLGGVLVYLVSGYALKPVRNLTRDIKAVSGDQLSLRIEPPAAQEINYLAQSFNGMLERLEQAFSAQKRFSTAAAHELKTPLASIRANVDVLRLSDEPTKEDYDELMEVLTRQTRRMSQLVDDLFTMSSLQECELSEDVSLSSVCAFVAGELEDAARQKDIKLTLEVKECSVRGNSIMLSRAISNVVENAIRYTPPGGEISLECSASEGEAQIKVSDTGPGIPDEHISFIFDPFYRVDPSRSRSHGGAGIGLAITEQIIAIHGGRITAENREDGGCSFTLSLPPI